MTEVLVDEFRQAKKDKDWDKMAAITVFLVSILAEQNTGKSPSLKAREQATQKAVKLFKERYG